MENAGAKKSRPGRVLVIMNPAAGQRQKGRLEATLGGCASLAAT